MKDNKFQYVKAAISVAILSFLGTVAISIVAPQPVQTGEAEKLMAYNKAKSIGKAIASRIESKSLTKGNGRVPASAEGVDAQGFMGTDDEGRPYHYSVLQTSAGVARVVVRSGGPSGQVEYVEEGGSEVQLPSFQQAGSLSRSNNQ
jgi:hypothetical protein